MSEEKTVKKEKSRKRSKKRNSTEEQTSPQRSWLGKFLFFFLHIFILGAAFLIFFEGNSSVNLFRRTADQPSGDRPDFVKGVFSSDFDLRSLMNQERNADINGAGKASLTFRETESPREKPAESSEERSMASATSESTSTAVPLEKAGEMENAEFGEIFWKRYPAPVPASVPLDSKRAPLQNQEAFPALSAAPQQRPQAPLPTEIQILRIATWNLSPFDFGKMTDPTISQKVAQLFLEFDIIAVQGIRSKNQTILDAMIYLLKEKGGQYGYACSSTISQKEAFLAFFYNRERVEIDGETLIDLADAQGNLAYPVLVASFRARAADPYEAFTLTLMNVWLTKGQEKEREALYDLFLRTRNRAGRLGTPEDDVVMLGSFNATVFEMKKLAEVPNLVAIHTDKSTTLDGAACDNFFFHSIATSEYLERFGVVDLSRFFEISFQEAQKIASHRPVWADFRLLETKR